MDYPFLNRGAVIIKLKKPFIDWLVYCSKEYDKEDQLNREDIKPEGFDSKHIYLIPEHDENDQYERYLRKHCREIFESELSGWYTLPEMWPQKRTWREFKEWFDYEIQTMVFDTAFNKPLECE